MESALADPPITSRVESRSDGTSAATVRDIRAQLLQAKERIAAKTLAELVEDGRRFVRENPVKAVVLSAGIGALVGFLAARRRP